MKVLLINGSLRANDACGEAVRRAEAQLAGAGAETGVFWPVKTENLPCSGCGACRGAGMCVADPRAGEFLRAAAQSDGFMIAAPVGLLGLGMDLRNLLKRAAELAARSRNNPFAGKPAAPLIIGRLNRRAARELRELTQALGLELCELTAFSPALIKKEAEK